MRRIKKSVHALVCTGTPSFTTSLPTILHADTRWMRLLFSAKNSQVSNITTQSISIFEGDNIWDKSSHRYRPRTAWDSGPSLWNREKVFYQLILPQCDSTGYHPKIHNWPLPPGLRRGVSWPPCDDPLVMLLTFYVPKNAAIAIFDMAFGGWFWL